jgi:hypothetical protein
MSDEDKARFVYELRAILPVAREAQEKITKFIMISVDRNSDDLAHLTQLISMVCLVIGCEATS